MVESDNPAPAQEPTGEHASHEEMRDLRRVLASVGACTYTAALKASVQDSLQHIVTASREAGHGIFMDCLPLAYGGRMSPRDLVAVSKGAVETLHSPLLIDRLVELHGIRGAIDKSESLVGIELDEEAIAHIPPDRLIELVEAPLLTKGLSMDEAELLFGSDFVQREEVEHDTVRHTWLYTVPGMSDDVALELLFEASTLVGWKDNRGKGRAIRGGTPRLEANAEIPHYVGGFHLASLATCIVLMEKAGSSSEEIDSFIDEATEEIRAESTTWPGPELETLTAIGDRYVHNRIRTDEAADRLEHYADRFTNYDPESHIVPREEFVAASLRILERVGGLERVSTVSPVIYWVAITLLILGSLTYAYMRTSLRAADAWPDLPIEDHNSSLSQPASEAPEPDQP